MFKINQRHAWVVKDALFIFIKITIKKRALPLVLKVTMSNFDTNKISREKAEAHLISKGESYSHKPRFQSTT
jgi:hypothetical protein